MKKVMSIDCLMQATTQCSKVILHFHIRILCLSTAHNHQLLFYVLFLQGNNGTLFVFVFLFFVFQNTSPHLLDMLQMQLSWQQCRVQMW